MYIPSEVNWKTRETTICQKGNFPANPTIQFAVTTRKPSKFAINLFMPDWVTEQTKLLINGKPVSIDIKPLSYVKLNRKWKNGDKIELTFDYKFYVKTMTDNQNMLALFYGPVLLAFETDKELFLKGSIADISNSISKQGSGMDFMLKNNGAEYKLLPFYEINNSSYGVYATITNEY
jgi:DUF1680 family protein